MEFDYRKLLADRRFAFGSIIGAILLIAISIYYFESILLTLVFFGILAFLFGLYGD